MNQSDSYRRKDAEPDHHDRGPVVNTSPHPRSDSRFGANPALTAKRGGRGRRQVENADYAAFLTRAIKAHGRRVHAGDIDGLAELVNLATELDTAVTHAVTGLRRCGYSWAEIGTCLNITRQAAHQRWADVVTIN
jgi:hypothetical protein